jgi:hypothetical protein
MPDDIFARTTPPAPLRKSGGSARLIAGTGLLSFLLGAALVGWLAYDGKLTWSANSTPTAPAQLTDKGVSGAASVVSPSPYASPTSAPLAPLPQTAAVEQRLAQLETRLTQLDLRASAASGNAARAEGLLIAIAARRAVERGMPLGTLADQLKLRFGDAQPNAVAKVIEAARSPVTLDKLVGALDSLSAKLTEAEAQESGWDKFSRQVSSLFVVRREASSDTNPAQRLAQARLLLRTGQVEAAADLVAALPGSAQAAGWIGDARRYASTQAALDQLETAAILEPRELQDSVGRKVEQASPVAGPTI